MSAPKPPVPETEEEREAVRLLEKRLTKCKRQLMELIDTESVYLKDMDAVEELCKGTALRAFRVMVVPNSSPRARMLRMMMMDGGSEFIEAASVEDRR